MGFLSKIVKTGLAAGAGITAYQAAQKAKRENGNVDADSFIRNFKDQAKENSRLVVDTSKIQTQRYRTAATRLRRRAKAAIPTWTRPSPSTRARSVTCLRP